MRGEHLFAGIPVREIDAATAWYEHALGRPPDLVPNEREAAWQLTESGWICLIADPDHAGSTYHTLLVQDLVGLVAALERRGAAPSRIENHPWASTTILTDPDGNRIQLAEPTQT